MEHSGLQLRDPKDTLIALVSTLYLSLFQPEITKKFKKKTTTDQQLSQHHWKGLPYYLKDLKASYFERPSPPLYTVFSGLIRIVSMKLKFRLKSTQEYIHGTYCKYWVSHLPCPCVHDSCDIQFTTRNPS